MRLFPIAAFAVLTLATAASAQSLAPDTGTTGVGAQLGWGVNEYLGVRGTVGAGSVPYSYTESGIRYDARAKPNVGLLMLDLHPFAGGFRISAGYGYNNTKIVGNAEPENGSIVINGVSYSAADVGTVEGEIHFQKSAPYLGLGWGIAPRNVAGLFFTSDVGVVFTKATGSVTGTCTAAVPPTLCAQLQSDLAAEAAEFVQEVEKVKYYPVARIGIGYRF
jgi:hypothetical protein